MSNGTMKVNNGRYEGEIRTMRIFLKFFLEKNQAATRSDKAPSHLIIAKAPAGHLFQAGVAWERSITKGEHSGLTMFSMQLEDPEFGDKPIYLSVFPQGHGGEYAITLERSRQQSVATDGPASGTDLPQAA